MRQSRRWPQPEFRFKHVLIQEAVYRTIVGTERRRLHREAAEWLEGARRAGGRGRWRCSRTTGSPPRTRTKAVDYLTRAGDKARQEYALDEAIGHYRELLPLLERRGESQEVALVLLQARARPAHLAALRRGQRHLPARVRPVAPERRRAGVDGDAADGEQLRAERPRPALGDRVAEHPALHAALRPARRGSGPSARSCRRSPSRWEISDDGLRYVFKLREGLRWSDGTPLTAHDVEFGIKRVLDPERPGSSAAIYFVLENGQDYCLGRTSDASSVGVRALDDLTVEFRLAAPAPYFLSVMNRPDGGPQPRHAIERDGDDWTATGKQVVSGPFGSPSATTTRLVLERRADYANVFRPRQRRALRDRAQHDRRTRSQRVRARRARPGRGALHAAPCRPGHRARLPPTR